MRLTCSSCADPKGGRIGCWDPPPLKNHKNIGFLSNTGSDPLKNCSYQASIQCWAIIGTPAKRHLMAFHWWADDGLLIGIHGSSLSLSTKKTQKHKNVVKVGPPLTKLSGSANGHCAMTVRKTFFLHTRLSFLDFLPVSTKLILLACMR